MRCKVGEQEEYRGADGHVELKEATGHLARANGMGRYGHVLRRPKEDVLMKALVHEVDEKRKQGGSRMKWSEQVKGSMRRKKIRQIDVDEEKV